MAEEGETPKEGESAGAYRQPAESQSGPSDAQREAVENLADKVDDNKVEDAGQKGGLRAALAARLDVLSRGAATFREKNMDSLREYRPLARSFFRGPARILDGVGAFTEKTTAFLRDRLQPKASQAKGPQTPSSK